MVRCAEAYLALKERVGITKQAVSQLVDDLETLGVLTRLLDPDDARARRVVFTDRGRQGLLDGLAMLRAMEEELAGAIGDKLMRDLRTALLAIHDQLTQNGESR